MLSTNYGIHRNEGLNTSFAITNVLERTDKLIKDYRFFFIILIVRQHKDNVKNPKVEGSAIRMKINEPSRIGAINSYQRNVESNQQADTKKSRRKDEVSISPEAMKMLEEQGRTQDAGRIQRIQELKEQVSSGTYQVDSSKLADKLLPYFKSFDKE